MVRALVGLWDYSGKGTPPMFGDYEAQRHWMEITVNLPINNWYRQCNDNDLLYWGLDYPPLTAYISYIFGSAAQYLVPQLVVLRNSRGYESVETKVFMRMTVMIADAMLFIPVMTELSKQVLRCKTVLIHHASVYTIDGVLYFLLYATACLLAPGLLLIDHGHFQYNSVCLSFSLLALMLVSDSIHVTGSALVSLRDIFGSVCFCLALNFKQMSLYYSPVFFVHLLRKALSGVSMWRGVGRVVQLGCTVLLSFALLWLPLCYSLDDSYSSCAATMLQVLHRQFPFSRGIFEDKVANIWYSLSVVVDFRQMMSPSQLVLSSLALTLLMLLPTCVCVFKHSSIDIVGLLLALMGSSLAFFLASFQVHEKSVLLMLVAATPLLALDPVYYGWVQLVGLFSMHPLLVRDRLRMPYWLCGAAYILLVLLLLRHRRRHGKASDKESLHASIITTKLTSLGAVMQHCFESELNKMCFIAASCTGMLVLHAAEGFLTAPARYPDLYPALFSIYGAANLCIIYLKCIHDQWAMMVTEALHNELKKEA